MAITLDELKAQNAAAEAAETPKTELTIPEEQVEEVEEVEVEEAEAGDDEEQVGEPEETEELEAWMQSEDQTSHDNDTVPVGVLAKTRSRLKAKIGEKDSEIEQLRAELEQLKSGYQQPTQQQQDNQLPPRPKLEDFDYDEDKHAAAVDDWNLSRFQAMQQQNQQQSQVQQQQEAQIEAIKQAANSHYQRAEKLIEEAGISADSYLQADTAVRSVFEQKFPGQGDQVADAVISQLASIGDGSEKVMYYLGRNPTALNALRDKLNNDPTGMQAMAYLGSLHAKATQAPSKKVSRAPKPAANVKGDDNTSSASKPMLKKYRDAHKSGNGQRAFDIKREARAKGIDTSNW